MGCIRASISSIGLQKTEDESLIATGHSVQVFMNQQYQLIWENPEFYLQWKKRWGQCEDDPNP